MTRVLIAGGGVAALEATLALRALAGDRVEIDVLAPDSVYVHRAMSVEEPFEQGEAWTFPLAQLVESAGARLIRGTLTGVALDERLAETEDGIKLDWEILLLAVGTRRGEGVPGALTFRGPADSEQLAALVGEAAAGRIDSVTFALPLRGAWALPLYQLAVMAQLRLDDAGSRRVRVDVVTPEEAPLAVFGHESSASVERTLETRGIGVRTQTTPVIFHDGVLDVIPGPSIRTDRVFSLSVPEPPRIAGIPRDSQGFVHTDHLGRVAGRDDLYAAGDITTFPIKQGGIATQQADSVAEAIAALVGAPIAPRPFRPVLQGLLFTGLTPRFLEAGLLSGFSDALSEPLWWPPDTVGGRYLLPFLAEHGLEASPGLERAA